MTKWKRKPGIVDAVQWTGKTIEDYRKFIEENELPHFPFSTFGGESTILINTKRGREYAERLDYIVLDSSGEYYPCDPVVFLAAYERAESIRYKIKTTGVEAWQWNGVNQEDYEKFINDNNLPFFIYNGKGKILIEEEHNKWIARKGDYIVRGKNGRFHTCKPDEFFSVYESAE